MKTRGFNKADWGVPTWVRRGIGLAFVLAAMSPSARAAVAPEIDPGSLLSGVTLLCCGLSILTYRTRRK